MWVCMRMKSWVTDTSVGRMYMSNLNNWLLNNLFHKLTQIVALSFSSITIHTGCVDHPFIYSIDPQRATERTSWKNELNSNLIHHDSSSWREGAEPGDCGWNDWKSDCTSGRDIEYHHWSLLLLAKEKGESESDLQFYSKSKHRQSSLWEVAFSGNWARRSHNLLMIITWSKYCSKSYCPPRTQHP